ncbi:MAG: ATP-dependent Clp protease adaptor ClpS [Planctomycetes bacterium]|nr:ATP-dependent Clp protease adaptor ClpS [Planctomycetota bacterium]
MTDTAKSDQAGAAATVERRPQAAPPKPKQLPPYKVLLHNDDVNTMEYVTETICKLTPIGWNDARGKMREADRTGVALLLVTHKERAELYQQQFASKSLTVTIEPDGE